MHFSPPAEFAIHIYFPDGEPPETGSMSLETLSPKWLGICRDLLEQHGPVMNHNMGSTLSHIAIRMGGPVGQLVCHGHPAFYFAVSLGSGSDQDKAALAHFEDLYVKACEFAQSAIKEESLAVLRGSSAAPSLLILDASDPELSDEDGGMLGELANHLAGAYLLYCGGERPDHPGSPEES
jgi:hypothetical protein